MHRRTLISVILACALAVLAACDRAPAPGAAPDTGATVLKRGNGGEPGSLDPALAEDIHAFNVLADLYEGLIATDASGNHVPGVALSWRVSDDGRSYDFELRAEARWSNGDPVVAADFVRAFRHVADPNVPSSYAFLLESVEGFAAVKDGDLPPASLGVVASDERYLTIRLERPIPYLLSILAMPIASPRHATTDDVISNGAYMLESRRAMGPIRLTRNPYYRDAADVSFDVVEYHPIVDDVAELNQYRTGELDVTQTIPSSHVKALREESPDAVRIAPMLALYYLAFDLTEAPFDDVELRQALSMAIDRRALVDVIGRGELPAFSLVPPGVSGGTSQSYDWRDLDDEARIGAAQRLFAASGFDAGTPVTLLYDAGGIHERIALAVSSMWRDALGLDVELDKREWQHFLDTRDARIEWQIMRFAWFGDYDDPMTFLEIFESESAQNLPRYRNAEFDELLARATGELDPDVRKTLMADAERTMLGDYPIIPLYFFVSKHLVRPSIEGFEYNVLDRHPSRYLRTTSGD